MLDLNKSARRTDRADDRRQGSAKSPFCFAITSGRDRKGDIVNKQGRKKEGHGTPVIDALQFRGSGRWNPVRRRILHRRNVFPLVCVLICQSRGDAVL